MNITPSKTCTAFLENSLIASGSLRDVASKIKSAVPEEQQSAVLIFDDVNSNIVEIDLRGTLEESMKRLSNQAAIQASTEKPVRAAGRPKLGVVAREITLLPRHWEWLNAQPGGASVALRKLVETAAKTEDPKNRIRRAQEICYRFMVTVAGNQRDFEEAARSLFAGNVDRFKQCLQSWPTDIRRHAEKLAAPAFEETVA